MTIILKESERLNKSIADFLRFVRPQEKRTAEFDIAASLSETLDLLANSPELLIRLARLGAGLTAVSDHFATSYVQSGELVRVLPDWCLEPVLCSAVFPGRRLMLAHPRSRYSHGVYRRGATTMHVSPGLGTTFLPFRFFARPEATELVLRCVRDGRT